MSAVLVGFSHTLADGLLLLSRDDTTDARDLLKGRHFGLDASPGESNTGVFGFLLLSAVNTAIVDLIAISFLMTRDGELPPRFAKLNGFGVPNLGLIVATIIPAILVVAVKDMRGIGGTLDFGIEMLILR